MKRLKIIALVTVGITLLSCSDAYEKTQKNVIRDQDVTGTYMMSSWNVPIAADFDGNGTANRNMMLESGCYNSSVMQVNNDGTYAMLYNHVSIDGTVTCESETTAGTWTRTENTFTTRHMSGNQDVDTNYSFAAGSGAQGNTLTQNMANQDYPTVNENGSQVYANGNVDMVMTRQ